jgi:probable rRNA maturation factor
MPEITLEIIIADKRWQRIPKLRAKLLKATREISSYLPKHLRFPCSMTLLLTSDAEMRRLNRDFRGMDKPTNVLSFPHFTHRQLTKMGKKKGRKYAGDIALGHQYIVAEVQETNKILINHTIHLLIHGILHILGYDHQSSAGASKMETLEKKVMSGLDLPDPYAPQTKERKAR